jgi:hypothetical protein
MRSGNTPEYSQLAKNRHFHAKAVTPQSKIERIGPEKLSITT